MMRLFAHISICVALFIAAACQKFTADDLGNWEPIKFDKSELNFSTEGGEQTVSILNYSKWCLLYGYEDIQSVNGSWEYTNIVRAHSSNDTNLNYHDTIEGEWYRVFAPDNGHQNKLVITVSQNKQTMPRHIIIALESGDAYGEIKINQQ